LFTNHLNFGDKHLKSNKFHRNTSKLRFSHPVLPKAQAFCMCQ